MVAIPFTKLFSFVLKSATNPLAKRVVSGAQRHESIRYTLSRLGQFTHATYYRVSVYLEGHTLKKIKRLDEDKALKAGSDILAEGLVYTIGGGLVVWEYMHSNREKEKKDARVKAKEAQEKKNLLDALEGIKQRVSNLESAITKHQAQGVAAPPLPGARGVSRGSAGAGGGDTGGTGASPSSSMGGASLRDDTESDSWGHEDVESSSDGDSDSYSDMGSDDPGR